MKEEKGSYAPEELLPAWLSASLASLVYPSTREYSKIGYSEGYKAYEFKVAKKIDQRNKHCNLSKEH